SVTSIALRVDGEEVPSDDIRFVLNDVEYALDDLQDKSETLWYLQAHALLRVRSDRPFELGEEHEVEIFGELRLPYMQIRPGEDGGPGQYVPNYVRQKLDLTVTDEPNPAPPLITEVE